MTTGAKSKVRETDWHRSQLGFLLFVVAFGGMNKPVAQSEATTPLVTLQYQIVGTQLKVSPAMVSVPKGVPGSVLVQITFGDGTTNATTAQMGDGAYVEATLRGPSFDARRLVGAPNSALLLPPLNLVGDYQLDNIRLVDSITGAVRMEGSPNSVPIHVFDQVLVSTSKLSLTP